MGSSPLTVLATRFRFCSDVKRDSFGHSRHRDLLKTKAEVIELMEAVRKNAAIRDKRCPPYL
jgi:hypothetical protein